MTAKKDLIHIEPTTRCTIGCSECPRTIFRGQYDLQDCDIKTTAKICSEFSEVLMCGNFGDPIYHPRFHELLHAIRSSNTDVSIGVVTNGAFRSKAWWEKTASLLSSKDRVIFSIDGLPTSNHVYRANSKWETIEVGIKTLRELSPSLMMIWKLVLFKYNEDQVDEAIALAKEYGFNNFRIVQSSRTDNKLLNPTKTIVEALNARC